jgi:hypothetical protein
MFGLSFLYPLFLIGAAAVAIPVVLHLFRRRTEMVVDFPAVRLLEKAPVEQQRRRRLRELILLALRATALGLLAIAFARPYVASSVGATPAPVTVVALDTSLSMSAPGQFDAARQAARLAVEQAPATHTVALLTFSDMASLVVAPTTDRGAVMSAIGAASPTAGGTRYRTALARAAEAIGANAGRVVVVTDMQQVGWEAGDEGAVRDNIEVVVSQVAAPAGNVAVSAVRRDGQTIVAAVHNYGMRAARLPVRLLVEGREVISQTVDVAPQAAAEARLTAALPPRGAAEIRIDDASGYQGDNSRFFVLDPPGSVPLFIITADPPASSNAGLYVERALGVADEGKAFDPQVVDGRAFSGMTDAQFAEPAGLVILGTRTLERPGRERISSYLRAGGRALLTLGPDTDVATLSDTVGVSLDADTEPVQSGGRTATLVAVDGRHPIFRPFLDPTGALGDVYIEQYRRLNDQPGRSVLARFSGAGSAMTEQGVGQGRLLVFASDLDNQWNRFPLNPAFVPWVMETARYLSQGREHRQSWTLPEIPAGARLEPGVQTVANRTFAINADVRESNPAHTSVEEFTGSVTRLNELAAERVATAAREQEEQQRLWQVGLLMMFLALAAEGFVGRKAI